MNNKVESTDLNILYTSIDHKFIQVKHHVSLRHLQDLVYIVIPTRSVCSRMLSLPSTYKRWCFIVFFMKKQRRDIRGNPLRYLIYSTIP